MSLCCALFVAVVVLSVVLLYANGLALSMRLLKLAKRRPIPDYPKHRLVLFQFQRFHLLPSVSSYCLKLETFLRAAKIPYVNNLDGIYSAKGKCPWVLYRGRAIADSQLVIEELTAQKQGVALDEHLNAEQKAVARVVQKFADEYLMLLFAQFRFSTDRARVRELFSYRLPAFVCRLFAATARQRLWTVGIGRHSESELLQWGFADLRAVSTILGSKDFLFGSKPSVADCSLFSVLCQLFYSFPEDSPYASVLEECANLRRFVERMRERYWPDWQQITDSEAKTLE